MGEECRDRLHDGLGRLGLLLGRGAGERLGEHEEVTPRAVQRDQRQHALDLVHLAAAEHLLDDGEEEPLLARAAVGGLRLVVVAPLEGDEDGLRSGVGLVGLEERVDRGDDLGVGTALGGVEGDQEVGGRIGTGSHGW